MLIKAEDRDARRSDPESRPDEPVGTAIDAMNRTRAEIERSKALMDSYADSIGAAVSDRQCRERLVG
jgi:hypothetical protein